MNTRRAAGAALLVYGVATFAANALIGAPGGQYEPAKVAAYMAPGHAPVAFAAAYLGCLASLALVSFVLRLRSDLGPRADLAWSLGVAAATTGVIGWFISGGVAVAMAEGGSPVRTEVPQPVVYTISEIGNLVSWCAPALFIGVVAILLSRVATLPRWLRALSAVAGVCGILAPFFFTFFVFLLWSLVLGATWVAQGSSADERVPASIV